MEFIPDFPQIVSAVREFWAESLLVDLIKFFLLVYSLVLVADLALLLYLTDLPGAIRKIRTGANLPLVSQSKTRKTWDKIAARLESGSPSQYKAAVLEADALAAEVLRSMGYAGENMQAQLEKIEEGKLAAKDALLSAHQMRNRIIHEADVELDRKAAETWLDHYRSFLEEVELLL